MHTGRTALTHAAGLFTADDKAMELLLLLHDHPVFGVDSQWKSMYSRMSYKVGVNLNLNVQLTSIKGISMVQTRT